MQIFNMKETRVISMRPLILMYVILTLDFVGFSFFLSCLPLLFSSQFCAVVNHLHPKGGYLLLGSFLGVFSLCQAIGNYLLSKRIYQHSIRFFFVLSYLGYMAGYFVCALAVWFSNLWLLFLGNAISGLLAFNLATIQAEICHLSTGRKRLQLFGLMGVCMGAAFFCGSYLFSLCCTLIRAQVLNLSHIFMVCSILAGVCLLLLYFFGPNFKVQWDQELFIKKSTIRKEQKWFAFGALLFALGWNIFLKFFQIYLLQNRALDPIIVSKMLGYFGVGTFIAQLLVVLNRFTLRFHTLIYFMMPILATSMFVLYFATQTFSLFSLMTLSSFIYGYIQSNMPHISAHLATQEESSSSMTFYQSTQAFARVLSPLIGGALLFFLGQSPFLMGGLIIIGSALVMHRLRRFKELVFDI